MLSRHQRQVLVLLAAAVLLLHPASATDTILDNVITKWINATMDVARQQGLPNNLAITEYAYVSVAIFRSLQAKSGAPEGPVAAFAAHTILSNRYPVSQARFDALLKRQLTQGKYSKEEVDKAREVAFPVAITLLKERLADPTTIWKDYTPTPPGTRYGYQFQPNQTFSLAPQLADSQPYVWPADKLRAFSENKDLKNGPVFEPPKTHEDLVAVVEAGARDSKTRTKYDTDTANFYALGAGLGGGSASISGLFLVIAQKVLPPTLSLKDTALFHARATSALYDAYVACWQVKYRTNYWRPQTAVKQGWSGFKGIPDWQPLLDNPPFPEYPSGHQCAAGAALAVIQKTLGTDKVNFRLQSDGAPDIGFRTYASLQDAANEAANSRLFAGLHFPSANWDGQLLGKRVGEYVFDNFLDSPAARPVTSPALNLQGQASAAAGVQQAAGAKPAVVTEAGGGQPKAPAVAGRRLLAATLDKLSWLL